MVVAGAWLQAANWLALALLDHLGNDPVVLIALASLHQIFGQLTGTGWTSWFGDVGLRPSGGLAHRPVESADEAA
jgi:hypothetical protein